MTYFGNVLYFSQFSNTVLPKPDICIQLCNLFYVLCIIFVALQVRNNIQV